MVSIPAAAGKIHFVTLSALAPKEFQFPQLRVRYIRYGRPVDVQLVFQFPQLRVRYIAKITKAHCISAAQFVQLSVFASFIIEEV